MDELTENAEEPDEGESKQSEVKLGKLQYKVCTKRHSRISKTKCCENQSTLLTTTPLQL